MVRRVTERGVELDLELGRGGFGRISRACPSGRCKAEARALATTTDVYVVHLLRRREGLDGRRLEAAMRAWSRRA